VQTISARFLCGSEVNYVTSIHGNSHHWSSDGASSVFRATPTSFSVYMFHEDGQSFCPVGGQAQPCGESNPFVTVPCTATQQVR
jgi:hypothetical protein